MLMQMVGSFAEFERAMIRERTQAGLTAARARGRNGSLPYLQHVRHEYACAQAAMILPEA